MEPTSLMGARRPAWILPVVVLGLLVVYPFFPFLDQLVDGIFGAQLRLDRQLVNIFIFAILALALNLQVGYAGLLQLGIAAFFAIGAFSTGIFTVEKYPFQIGFWGSLVLAPLIAGLAGLALGAPTIRLKGDYLAIVTLGFGEVTRVVILNLENITDGPRGLNPIPSPWLPPAVKDIVGDEGGRLHFLGMYFIALVALAALVVGFRLLERSRLGRELVALREDELATACMGINPAKTKLIAFAVGAAIAGLAGALYSTNLTTTAEPNTYDFSYSIMVLCCIIIGGLGSVRGVLLGAGVLLTFDNVISPLLTQLMQKGSLDSFIALFGFGPDGRWLMVLAAAAVAIGLAMVPRVGLVRALALGVVALPIFHLLGRALAPAEPPGETALVVMHWLRWLVLGGGVFVLTLGPRFGLVRALVVGVALAALVVAVLPQPVVAVAGGETRASVFATFTNWRWIIFGVALVLMMRFKPEGLWPSSRVKEELHEGQTRPGPRPTVSAPIAPSSVVSAGSQGAP